MSLIKIKMFGTLTIEISGQVIDLESLLGKQLSSLFALFVCNRKHHIEKEDIHFQVWGDHIAVNQNLKASIFRMRKIIKTNPHIANIDWIVTNNNTYQLNPNLEIETDFELLDDVTFDHQITPNPKSLYDVLKLYTADFLVNLSYDWIYSDRNYYRTLYIRSTLSYCEDLMKKKKYSDVAAIAKTALSFNPLHEGLIEIYLHSLYSNKQYNDALKYYTFITKQYRNELDAELEIESFSKLIQSSNNNRINIDNFVHAIKEDISSAPYYCDYLTFKTIIQYEHRKSFRDKSIKYIMLATIEKNESIELSEQFKEKLSNTLRSVDVYTQVNMQQFAVLLSIAKGRSPLGILNALTHRLTTDLPPDIRVSFVTEVFTHKSNDLLMQPNNQICTQ